VQIMSTSDIEWDWLQHKYPLTHHMLRSTNTEQLQICRIISSCLLFKARKEKQILEATIDRLIVRFYA